MKKILLISNYVFHYRIKNYNYFFDEFLKLGYEFHVLACDAQKVDFEIKFPLITKKFNFISYKKIIDNLKPAVVIDFLHLKNPILFPLTYYCKLMKIPIVYWNFGINLCTPNARLKNMLYHHIHNLSDAIILYSPLEKKFVNEKNHHKVFIAYNTLNLTTFDTTKYTDRHYLRNKYGIKEDNIVLFVGRVTKAKKLDNLLSVFRNSKDIAVVIVGKGISEDQLNVINQVSNYYYLGETYNSTEIGNIFNNSDVLCIPGNVGLAMIDSFFWGKPVVTLSGFNSPEIYYLKDNYNGYLADTMEELERKTIDLFKNKDKYKEMSDNARKTYENEAHISKMFNGFKETVRFIENPD